MGAVVHIDMYADILESMVRLTGPPLPPPKDGDDSWLRLNANVEDGSVVCSAAQLTDPHTEYRSVDILHYLDRL